MTVKKKKIKKKIIKKPNKSAKKADKADKVQKVPAVTPQYVSRLKFSKILGIAYSTLQHNIKNGNIQLTVRDGLKVINVETEKVAYLQSRKGKYKTNLKIDDEKEDKIVFNIGQANLRTQVYKSKLAELDYYKQLDFLIPVIRVNSTWQNIAQDLQKALLAVPARIGPLMAGITDPHEATQTLKHELTQALIGISEKGLTHDHSNTDSSPDISEGAA